MPIFHAHYAHVGGSGCGEMDGPNARPSKRKLDNGNGCQMEGSSDPVNDPALFNVICKKFNEV